MNTSKIFLVIVVLVVVAGGGWYFISSPEKMEDVMEKTDDAMMKKEEGAMTDKKEDEMMKDDSMKKEEDTMMKAGSYESFAPEKVTLASDTHDVVLFFRASWCPTCRAVDADIKANLSKIPSSLAILDIDYDNSTALKQKYGVTYQHTFVQVDADGNLIKKWTGSPTLATLVAQVK